MKYFLDTEFLEGTQKKLFGETKPTIDLISIGIVCEDGREYYAISKDFNLKEAWNRYDIKTSHNLFGGQDYKVYWLRDNVLKPIWEELHLKDLGISHKAKDILQEQMNKLFSYKSLKYLINKYGKTNKQIAEDIIEFTSTPECRMVEKYGIVLVKTFYRCIRMYKINRKNYPPRESLFFNYTQTYPQYQQPGF